MMHAPATGSSTEALSKRLAALPTAVVCDVLAAMGYPDQVLASCLRPVGASKSFAGPAVCLLGSDGPEPDAVPGRSRPVFETDRQMTTGCVAVIAAGGHRVGAVIGGNVALAWRMRGCISIVTDGGVRDASECDELGLSVFAAFVGPMSNKGLWAFREIGVPITLPGQRGEPIPIRPGDIVQGDTDGLVVVPAELAADVVRDAEILESMEAKIRAELQRGEDREVVYARHDRFGHIKKRA